MEDSEESGRTQEQEAPKGLAQAIGARNLLIIIVTMPVFFLLVVMATISIFGRPGETPGEQAAPAETARVSQALSQPPEEARGALAPRPAAALAGDPSPLVLPRGATLGAMALDGDRLAVRIEAEDGGEIVIYDLARGAVAQRIKIAPGSSGEEL